MKSTHQHISILLLLIGIFIPTTIPAKANDRTTRRGLKVKKEAIAPVSDNKAVITVTEPDSITLAGYDKPLRSSKETLFVTNKSSNHITAITIHCEYSDMNGRQLHAADHTVKCVIPPGETRQISFRSWDKQQSFYYRLSPKPRRADATPYDVKCTTIAIETTR